MFVFFSNNNADALVFMGCKIGCSQFWMVKFGVSSIVSCSNMCFYWCFWLGWRGLTLNRTLVRGWILPISKSFSPINQFTTKKIEAPLSFKHFLLASKVRFGLPFAWILFWGSKVKPFLNSWRSSETRWNSGQSMVGFGWPAVASFWWAFGLSLWTFFKWGGISLVGCCDWEVT